MLKTRYTAEELLAMQPEELDRLIEALVLGSRPEPETVRWIRDNWLERQRRRNGDVSVRQEVPEYSSSHAGMCLIEGAMRKKGFQVEIEADGSIGYGKDGGEIRYAPFVGALKTVAIAAVLAVQGE